MKYPWDVDTVLEKYRGLSLKPHAEAALFFAGEFRFIASTASSEEISDEYNISVAIPETFPRVPPQVKETAGRIKGYHINPDGSLCLGSPMRIQLLLNEHPTLDGFIEHGVVPFLYGHSFYEKHNRPPLGELAHGDEGALHDYMEMLCVSTPIACVRLLYLMGLKKRIANKCRCPCESGRRLGKCHNLVVNKFREKLGRRWCVSEAVRLLKT